MVKNHGNRNYSLGLHYQIFEGISNFYAFAEPYDDALDPIPTRPC